MTEYDYSPEAFEAYMQKQYKIATWVDKTNNSPRLCNPFTPSTPAVHAALALKNEDEPYNNGEDRRHRRKESRDSRRDRENRYADRETTTRPPRNDKDTAGRHPPSTSRPHSKRHRSSSTSATPTRPDHMRSQSIPQPLQLGPYHQNGYLSSSQLSSASPTYQHPLQYQYPAKMTSPRDSKHSSQTSSSATRVSPQSHHPPHSAPPLPRPSRSQTTPPNYGNGIGYAMPQVYPNQSTPYLNAPQFPHSYYTNTNPKPAPLLKRLFKSLTGGSSSGNKHQHRPPPRKRSMSF